MKVNPRAEVEIVVCKSKDTDKLYYGLFKNNTPVKYWDYDLVSAAGKDIISAFDLGYDIRFQFPIDEEGLKKIVPRTVKMFNEPCSEKKNNRIKECFFEEKENK